VFECKHARLNASVDAVISSMRAPSVAVISSRKSRRLQAWRVSNASTYNYRVNSLPTLFGEKLALRRLNALPPADLSLASLRLDARQIPVVDAAIRAPNGLMLVRS
jgi:type II secretory ATPase GspE/PulE/Tfp pilus assembly ATPase PilB-like protein